jgi:methylmalonyl-CoA mutase C-terminal domain/subunit
MDKKIRVIIGKPGLDGHDRGAKVVAAALRDAGMGESIVEAAIQEDVDIIGLSILSGAHMTIFPKVLNLLKKKGAKDIIVTGGGIIPEEDMKKLEKKGIKKMFGPGTPTTEIVDWINKNIKAKAKKTKTKKIKKTKKAKKKRSVKKSKKLGKNRS